MKRYLLFLLLASVTLITCKQSNPEDVLGRQGDVVYFAGRRWDIKYSNLPMGPGPNNFSRLYDDVWVDENGFLHLTVAKHNDTWYSSEVVGQDNLGYGTYIFTIQADPMSFSENVVFGLFTWDSNTLLTDGNSEVDIEFSKWGDSTALEPTTFSVQPVNFGTFYPERTREKSIDPDILKGVTTHLFNWTDTLITWYSYDGEYYENATPIATWSFNLNNPPRVKQDVSQQSQPIVIPAPGATTNCRMNLWTLPFSGIVGPNNGLTHEVVIRNFKYIPMQ